MPRHTFAWATWLLIGFFAVLGAADVIITVLHAAGSFEGGTGAIFGAELPAWLIAAIDGSAALSMLGALRLAERGDPIGPWVGVASGIVMLGRATWTIVVPVLVPLAVYGLFLRSVRPIRD